MAFDQATRSRLQRFVTTRAACWRRSSRANSRHDYGLDPKSGTVDPVGEPAPHQRRPARDRAHPARHARPLLRGGLTIDASTGLDRIVREQAFTVLNRLAALRMAEARGLLIESVGNGYQAKGFQLYARVAGSALGETGDAYRVYLFSVFDELAPGSAGPLRPLLAPRAAVPARGGARSTA